MKPMKNDSVHESNQSTPAIYKWWTTVFWLAVIVGVCYFFHNEHQKKSAVQKPVVGKMSEKSLPAAETPVAVEGNEGQTNNAKFHVSGSALDVSLTPARKQSN